MFTVDIISPFAHYDRSSLVAASALPDDLLSVIAIAVVIMLLGFALDWLRGIVVALWAMARLLFSALGAALLVIAALAVAFAAVIVQIRGR
ncbi:MAG TPA: hypothetical protein VFR35_04610 [Actinoplanes sp.]|nr:hypothetical protein [Actinoplanes sp.]